jgi:hypothetical protein
MTKMSKNLEGYHRFKSENGEEFGSFEVFEITTRSEQEAWELPSGWFWAAGFPGCLYDGEPVGPFPTALAAYDDANPFDDAREGVTP